MRLHDKVAIVYGAAGSMGRAVARAFASEGASTYLAGRTLASVRAVADEITAAGGQAEAASVDVDDEAAVEQHADEVVARAGRIDISFNAVGMNDVQNVPLVDMSIDDFMLPIVESARRHFVTTRAAARRMVAQGSGTIVLLSSSAAQESRHQMGGFNLACAAIEALTRSLAGEVGRSGVRIVALRPNFTPETAPGIPDDSLEPLVRDTTLGRLPRLHEVAAAAVFAASDDAGAMSGAVLNLTCGAIVD
jgi:3-oxoacyl-[acyl-carrier protein] reductase